MASSNQPQGVKFAETHEWVRVDGDEAYIGISNYAQRELGEIVYVNVEGDAGRHFAAGEKFGEIDSVKSTSELFVPVSGDLVRVNETLQDHPEKVNDDPYGDGWMIVLRMSDPSELEKLMDAGAYASFAGE